MRPNFDATLIAELRQRVIDHNEAHPAAKAKLGDLRKVYESGYRRSTPGLRAMRKVDTYLEQLAKGEFDESDHPRGRGGEFSSKGSGDAPAVSIPLPQSTKDHRALQQSNAGYRAMTTDVLPEHRNEAIGTVVRDGGATLAGAGIIGALARHKDGGLAERVVAKPLGVIGATVGGTAGHLAGAAAKHAKDRFYAATRVGKAGSHATVQAASQKLADAGRRYGEYAGTRTVRRSANLVRGALAAVSVDDLKLHPDHVKQLQDTFQQNIKSGMSVKAAHRVQAVTLKRLQPQSGRFANKAAAFGAMAGLTAYAIRNRIKDGWFDPAGWGRVMDGFSLREVQKAAMADELGRARTVLTAELAKGGAHGGSIEDLSAWLTNGGGKLIGGAESELAKGQPWGQAAIRLFTGLAGLGGAAAAGTAAYGATRAVQAISASNSGGSFDDKHPRDDHGRFSVKGSGTAHRVAQLGALLGGAAASIAMHRGLTRYNHRIAETAVAGIRDATARAIAKTNLYQGGQVGRFQRGAANRVESMIHPQGKHPEFADFRKKLAAVDEMHASSADVIRARVANAYHRKLAEEMSAHPDLQIPKGKTGWQTLAQATHGSYGEQKVRDARDATITALSNVDAAGFSKMLDSLVEAKAINAGQRAALMKTRAAGIRAEGQIDAKLKGHTANVKAAQTTREKAKAEMGEARAKLDAATTELKLKPEGPEKDAAASALADAKSTHDKAMKAHAAAAKKATKLETSPTGVEHPFTGEAITGLTDQEVAAAKSRARVALTDQARTKAKGIVEGELEGLKGKQLAMIDESRVNQEAIQATRAATYGAPKRAQRTIAATRKTHRALVDAEQDLASAHVDHLPNQVKFDQLQEAMKTRKVKGQVEFVTPKGKTKAEADVLRQNKDEILANHAATSKTLATMDQAHKEALYTHHQAVTQFQDAMLATPPSGKPRKWISDELAADIKRVRRTTGKQWAEFLDKPTGQSLVEIAGTVKGEAAKQLRAARDAGKDTGKRLYRDLMTRDGGADGKTPVFDYGKALQAAALGTAAAGAIKHDLIMHAERLFGSGERKQKAKADRAHIRHDSITLDPLSGAGIHSVHIQDPANPKDRVVLTGQRYDTSRGTTTPLVAGTSLKGLSAALREREDRRKQKQQGNGGGGGGGGGGGETTGPMAKMSDGHKEAAEAAVAGLRGAGGIEDVPTFQGGPTFGSRKADFKPKDDDAELKKKLGAGEQAAFETLRNAHGLKDKSPGKGEYHEVLGALFSKHADQLRPGQRYRMLTGYDEQGRPSNSSKPILQANEGYGGTADEAHKALSAEVGRVMQHNAPQGQKQIANLHRAIGLVGKVKGLSPDRLKPLYDQVNAAHANAAEAPKAAETPAPASTRSAPAVVEEPMPEVRINKDRPLSSDQKKAWNTDTGARHAAAAASALKDTLGLHLPSEEDHLAVAIHGMARNLHPEGFSEQEAVGTISNIFNRVSQSEKHRNAVVDMLSTGDANKNLWSLLHPLVARAVQEKRKANTVNKVSGADLDSLERLTKLSMDGFVESLHPRAPSGSAVGGEFVAGAGGEHGGSVGTRLASEVGEAGAKVEGKGGDAVPARTPKPQSWAHPVRVGNELGSSVGFDAGLQVASRLLPAGLGGIVRTGIGLAAGVAGGELGSAAGNTAGRAVQRATTGHASTYREAEMPSVGSLLSNSAGAMVAGTLGNSAGTALGTVAGRAIGGVAGSIAGPVGAVLVGGAAGYAGGLIGQHIYDYFAGYDKPSVDRAMTRFSAPKQARA